MNYETIIMNYEELKKRISASAFRSRFLLTLAERAYVAEKGFPAIRAQAERIVREHLGPAHPIHDGKQTPMRGHAVFKAQHATATCCRGCLKKWHGIPEGRALDEAEIADISDLITEWIRDNSGDLSNFPNTPDLFS
jgi:hypothetical protein